MPSFSNCHPFGQLFCLWFCRILLFSSSPKFPNGRNWSKRFIYFCIFFFIWNTRFTQNYSSMARPILFLTPCQSPFSEWILAINVALDWTLEQNSGWTHHFRKLSSSQIHNESGQKQNIDYFYKKKIQMSARVKKEERSVIIEVIAYWILVYSCWINGFDFEWRCSWLVNYSLEADSKQSSWKRE